MKKSAGLFVVFLLLITSIIIGSYFVNAVTCYKHNPDGTVLSQEFSNSCPDFWFSINPGDLSGIKVDTSICNENNLKAGTLSGYIGLPADQGGWGFKKTGENICLWEQGILDQTNGLTGGILKYLILILVVMLIYSALVYANFPDSYSGSGGITRFVIALITGIIATFAITSSELISVLQSYTALGVTLALFFPVLILAFFTLVVASKASPIGIFTQKIMWMIYSVYLFIKSLLLWYIGNYGYSLTSIGSDSKSVIFDSAKHPILSFFIGKETITSALAGNSNGVILTIMIFMAVAIFSIFVIGNKPVTAWFAKEKLDSELLAQRQMLDRSHAYDKARSQEIQKN